MLVTRKVEHFSVDSQWIKDSQGLRLDASFFNPRVAQAIDALKKSGLPLKRLGDVVKRVFIPPRFARTYVQQAHGVPFLQGSHVVHFQPADLKYVSQTVHKNIDKWIIRDGWILVTRSGTVGRVAITPSSWDGWAASEHILRIVPNDDGECPSGYLCAFLSSPIGQAQLTAQIYGAVVDELTEDQTKAVLVPVAADDEHRKRINAINHTYLKSVQKRAEASTLATDAVNDLRQLIPQHENEQPEVEIIADEVLVVNSREIVGLPYTEGTKASPGPKADTLKIHGDWQESVKKSFAKKKPAEGWPK